MTGLRSALLVLAIACAAARPSTAGDPADCPPAAAASPDRRVILDVREGASEDRLGGGAGLRTVGPAWASIAAAPDPAPQGSPGPLRIAYRFEPGGRAQAIVYIGLNGLDARPYDHLQVRVKSESPRPPALKIKVLRPTDARPGMMASGSTIIAVSEQWRCVQVPLNRMPGLSRWDNLSALQLILDSRRAPVEQGTVLIDDLALVRTGEPGPSVDDPVLPADKRALVARLGGPQALQAHLRDRLSGWPARAVLDEPLPADDRAFLARVAADTWRGLDALRHRENGLPVDTVAFAEGSTDPGRAEIGDYTSPTNIGVYLASAIAAHHLGLLLRDDALARARQVLASLQRLERHRGMFFNFYDTTTLERTSNFISVLDSAWLAAGLMVLRTGLPEVHEPASQLLAEGRFDWLYDDVERLLYHGYHVNLGLPSEYHYGLLYTEARLASLVAIGKGDVPETHWFELARTLPPEESWQTQPPRPRAGSPASGLAATTGYYEVDGQRFVPSWGGSMFEALMPALFVDEARHAPESLGLNNRVHTRLQRAHALRDLGYPVWGLSPSATPSGYAEYGVWYLGTYGYPAGRVTPHAAALALLTMPEDAIRNLRALAGRYPVYGDFGFYDAVDPLSAEVTYKYLALDQGILFLALANHLREGVIQRLFTADPIAQRALPVLGRERFFE